MRILMLGGGVSGLAGGLMLARDGHEVTVLERDGQAVPESGEQAWERWSREGVIQFRQAHILTSAGRAVLEDALPDVLEALVSAGAVRFDPLALRPPSPSASAADDDGERFVTYTARRPVFEQVLARAARDEPGMDVRRGQTASGLTIDRGGATPHVTGVRTDAGETLSADLVVDASGRSSQTPRWLSDAGIGPVHEESEDSGFIYYTRFFRSADGSTPQMFGPALAAIGTFSLLTIPADNGTWSVTVYVSRGDQALKRMRDVDAWTSVVKACPAHAHWLEGEPTSEIAAMGGVVDRYRRLSLDGRPLVSGLALLGDAWACTNPSLGRGMTLALMHARCLRELVGSAPEDPLAFAQEWDGITERTLTPWYRETVEEDRARLGEIEALRQGREPPAPSEPSAVLRRGLLVSLGEDPELFEAFLESRCCLTPLTETFARPGVAERILELADGREPMAIPGPDREELLALLA
jgi:2-polyprenyl-6-methoxyphenol hydroxylase-like FAD-dependent oxidoreductase